MPRSGAFASHPAKLSQKEARQVSASSLHVCSFSFGWRRDGESYRSGRVSGARECRSGSDIERRCARSRRMHRQAERPGACRQALVLSHEPRAQEEVLVPRRRRREDGAGCTSGRREDVPAAPVARAKKQPITEALVEQADDSDVQPSTSDARAEFIDEPKVEQPLATIPQPQLMQPQLVQPQVSQPQVCSHRSCSRNSQPQAETSPAASESAAPRNWTMASRWPDAQCGPCRERTDGQRVCVRPRRGPKAAQHLSSSPRLRWSRPSKRPSASATRTTMVSCSQAPFSRSSPAARWSCSSAGGTGLLFPLRNMARQQARARCVIICQADRRRTHALAAELRDEIEELLEMSRRQARAH